MKATTPFPIKKSRGEDKWPILVLSELVNKPWYSRVIDKVENVFSPFFTLLSMDNWKVSMLSILPYGAEQSRREEVSKQGFSNKNMKSEDIVERKLTLFSEVPVSHISNPLVGFYLNRNNASGARNSKSRVERSNEQELDILDQYTYSKREQIDGVIQLKPSIDGRNHISTDLPSQTLVLNNPAKQLSNEIETLLEAGVWEYSFESEEFMCTEYVYTLLNIPLKSYLSGFTSLLPYFTGKDRLGLELAWDNLVNQKKDLSYQAQVSDGEKQTWVSVKGKAIVKEGRITKVVGVIQDVTDRVENERRLVAEKIKAEYEAEMKADFVCHMSHELRTPLNAIMGLTYLLLQDEEIKHEHRENLNSVHFSSQNLLSLINNTLDFSRLKAGKVELEKVNFNLHELLRNTHKALSLRAKEKKINFELYVDPCTPLEVAGDPIRLMQVLNNLLSNAIKFTDKGSVNLSVEVLYQAEQEFVLQFSINDTGIGIPVEKQNSIFENFVQANSSTHRQYGGTGLGLAITKNIVELHRGSIQVKSTEGKGSVFTVRMRFTKPQPTLKTIQKVNTTAVANSKLSDMKVLVVDDNEMNRTVATKLLSSWQVKVDTATDGKEALELIESNNYDLVLMDLYMPVQDGFQTVSKMRKMGMSVPVIALTANANEQEKVRIMDAGVNDYLSKPYFPQDLMQKLLQYV